MHDCTPRPGNTFAAPRGRPCAANTPRARYAAIAAAALLVLPAAALAQYSPDASMSLGIGYGATALSSATLSGTRQLGKKGQGPDELSPTMQRYCAQWPDEGVCRADRARKTQQQPQPQQHAVQQQAARAMQRLRPEYELRLQRDGKASADRWLQDTAYRLGQQEGRAARARQ